MVGVCVRCGGESNAAGTAAATASLSHAGHADTGSEELVRLCVCVCLGAAVVVKCWC